MRPNEQHSGLPEGVVKLNDTARFLPTPWKKKVFSGRNPTLYREISPKLSGGFGCLEAGAAPDKCCLIYTFQK